MIKQSSFSDVNDKVLEEVFEEICEEVIKCDDKAPSVPDVILQVISEILSENHQTSEQTKQKTSPENQKKSPVVNIIPSNSPKSKVNHSPQTIGSTSPLETSLKSLALTNSQNGHGSSSTVSSQQNSPVPKSTSKTSNLADKKATDNVTSAVSANPAAALEKQPQAMHRNRTRKTITKTCVTYKSLKA